jgi:hypothetical protein
MKASASSSAKAIRALELALIRGWPFPLPGVSTFRNKRGKIVRVAKAGRGPFDPFCPVWHLFALLADGVDGWAPQYRY